MNDIYSRVVKDGDIFFKYAKGMRDIFGKEFHTYHEIFFFLEGEAEFISENQRLTLTPRTLAVIPKESYHQFTVHGAESGYRRCVFNFFDVPELSELIAQKMNKIYLLEANNSLNYIFEKAIAVINSKLTENSKATIIKALLTLVLSEIEPRQAVSSLQNEYNPITTDCIEYITSHITEPLNVSVTAAELNVSPSYLSHVFKKDMNISLYKYILEKKLITAHQKIMSGEPATKAAFECGFSDYSGFYKQFKKMFGKAPSQK